jgi:NAD(P)-dependent dehydrogenase (short-subunit alcohol dehydrogenase family)
MTVTDITPRPTVLLTGPTRGLGSALVDRLATHPLRPVLVLAGRDPTRLAQTAARARRAGAPVHTVELDLADLRSVAEAAAQVRVMVADGLISPVTSYIANAGIQLADRQHVSAQGHEQTFAVNVLGQHVLLRDLRPALADEGHVVLLGSSTHRTSRASFYLMPGPQWRDPVRLAEPDTSSGGRDRSAGSQAYADSKLALVTLAHAWARELAGVQRVNVYDPGLMPGTGLVREGPAYVGWTWRHVMPVMRVLPGAISPRGSARLCADLALGESHGAVSGAYVELGRVTEPAAPTLDRARQARLWEVLEELSVQPGVAPDGLSMSRP